MHNEDCGVYLSCDREDDEESKESPLLRHQEKEPINHRQQCNNHKSQSWPVQNISSKSRGLSMAKLGAGRMHKSVQMDHTAALHPDYK